MRVTGVEALRENTSGGGGPGLLAETLFGAAAALAILAWVFASALAVVPLLTAAVSILTTFLLLFGLAQVTEISFVVQFLVGLIGGPRSGRGPFCTRLGYPVRHARPGNSRI